MNSAAYRKNGFTSVIIRRHRFYLSRFYTASCQTNCQWQSAAQLSFSRRSKRQKSFGARACSHSFADLPQTHTKLTPSTYLSDCDSFDSLHMVTISNMRAGKKDCQSCDATGVHFVWGSDIVCSTHLRDGIQVEVNNVMHINSLIIPIVLSEEDFRDQYINRNEPCIIKNLTEDWPASRTKKWSIEVLLRTYRSAHFLYNYWFAKLNDDTSTDYSDKVTVLMKIEANENDTNRGTDIVDEIVSVDEEDQQNLQNIITLQSFLKNHNAWEIQNQNRATNNNELNPLQIENAETVSYNFTKYSANFPYIFDSAFDRGKSRNLLLDYHVPSIFNQKNEILRLLSTFTEVEFRWFLLGPKLSGKCN